MQEEYGKQVILQRHENNKSSIVLGNKAKVLSKEKQNEITRFNEPRVFSETILERVNTTFQHKYKPKEASVNDNITHTIVENSNASDGNVTMIRNDDKEGKEIVTSGNIIDEEAVKDTNNTTLKQNILRTSIVVAKASKVSVNNTGDYIVTNVLHDISNKHTIEREEEDEETDDINTIKQESSSAKNKEKEERVEKNSILN